MHLIALCYFFLLTLQRFLSLSVSLFFYSHPPIYQEYRGIHAIAI